MPPIQEHIPEYIHRGDIGRSDRPPFTPVGYDDIAVCQKHGVYAFSVYTYLSLRMGANEATWPSLNRIAEDLGIAYSTVQKAIAVLIEAELLTRYHRPEQQSNLYVVHAPPKIDAPSNSIGTPSNGAHTPSHGGGVHRHTVTKKIQGKKIHSLPLASPNGDNLVEPIPEKKRRSRPRNPTWDALAEVVGAPMTKSETSDFAKTVNELIAIEAPPDKIPGFKTWWRKNFKDALLTHRCFRNHWKEYIASGTNRKSADQLDYERWMALSPREKWAEYDRQDAERERGGGDAKRNA